MTTWRSEFDSRYKEWRKIARKAAGADLGDELLHDTLLKILEKDEYILEDIHERGKLNNYVSNSIRLAARSTNSSYNYTLRKFEKIRSDLKNDIIDDVNKSVGMRLENEQLDIFISRLPYFERELFFLYALDDFSYQALAKETGIPLAYLYRTIQKAKTTLRNSLQI